jgi:DNA polymerase V
LDTVKEAILSFAGRACKKLRKMNLVACQFQVFLLSNRFKADRPQFTKSIEVGLTPATNDTVIICKTIGERLPKVWQPDMSVKKAGILMMGLCQPEYAPQDLFSQTSLSPSPLMTALDRIESRFGKEAVTVGRAQRARGMDWFMTSENRSPCYTTKWQDIKTIR